MTPLQLDDSLLLGKGNERLCYIHPEDPSRTVKVAYREAGSRNQNLIESLYYRHLENSGVDFSHITRCYGWTETSKGKGLVFERVANADGSAPQTLHALLKAHALQRSDADALMEELRTYLETNGIVFADVALTNVLCCTIPAGGWKLVIVDGLGSRRMGLKFWLVRHCRAFARYKTKGQWKKVMRNYALYWATHSA